MPERAGAGLHVVASWDRATSGAVGLVPVRPPVSYKARLYDRQPISSYNAFRTTPPLHASCALYYIRSSFRTTPAWEGAFPRPVPSPRGRRKHRAAGHGPVPALPTAPGAFAGIEPGAAPATFGRCITTWGGAAVLPQDPPWPGGDFEPP